MVNEPALPPIQEPSAPAQSGWQSLFEPVRGSGDRIGSIFNVTAWVAVNGIALFFLRPREQGYATHTQLGLPPCPSVVLFDRPCPGCGLTTCFCHMIRGQVVEAFQANAVGPFLWLMFTVGAAVSVYCLVKGLRFRTEAAWFNRLCAAVLIVFLGYGAGRFLGPPMNSPFYHRSMGPEESRNAPGVPEKNATSQFTPRDQIGEPRKRLGRVSRVEKDAFGFHQVTQRRPARRAGDGVAGPHVVEPEVKVAFGQSPTDA